MRKQIIHTAEIVLFAILFVVSFGFFPLFTENQNTKYLHGFAQQGYGYLENDWLTGTVDPLPFFSSLVSFIHSFDMPVLFYLCQGITAFVYALFSGLIARDFFKLTSRESWYLFFALFLFIHSPVIFNDIYWGFSEQYLFIQYFQPSSFAVLYLPAIYLFLKKRYFLSAIIMAVPGLFHAGYTLVSSVLFICCFSYQIIQQKQWKTTIFSGLIFSVILLPAVLHQLVLLAPTSEGLTREAMSIIADYRIPHHTEVLSIFHFDFIIKSLCIIACLWLVKKQPLRWILQALSIFLLLSILVGWLSQNAVVSVSTPWRFSVLVVPLAFLLLSARLCERVHVKQLLPVAAVIIVFFTVSGQLWTNRQFKEYDEAEGMELLYWLKKHRKDFAESTFLIESREEYTKRFRLETGLPVYVNWKTHPYKDIEVIEWYHRMKESEQFYGGEMDETQMRNFLKRNHISHVVLPAKEELAGFQTIYQDNAKRIIAVN